MELHPLCAPGVVVERLRDTRAGAVDPDTRVHRLGRDFPAAVAGSGEFPRSGERHHVLAGDIQQRQMDRHLLDGADGHCPGRGLAAAHAPSQPGDIPDDLPAAGWARSRGGSGGSGMSSTVVVCALRFDRATIAHVGDSRCYLIRNQKARVITQDHTVANEQLRLGLLSKREANSLPTRHVLSRSLGSGLFVKVEIDEIQLLPEDVLLLCSDGLHGAVADEEIAATVGRNHNLEATANELVSSANQQDGSDNVSVQLIRIRGVERTGMYRGRPYKLR